MDSQTDLIDVLAFLYQDEASARRVVADAQLNAQHVDFSGSAINRWHAILTEAEKSNCIKLLMRVVFKEYGKYPQLFDAYESYRSCTPITSLATPKEKMICFLSYSFHEEDKNVGKWFHNFLGAFPNLRIIEARHRPAPPSQQVAECIKNADLICSVITKRNNGISKWLLKEIEIAHQEQKIILSFVEKGIRSRSLGILPNITEFKVFEREALGIMAPEYLRYVYNAREEVFRRSGTDRATLNSKIKMLNSELTILEANRYRIDDL